MFQNHTFVDPLQNRCSRIIHKIHRKTPVLESLFKRKFRSRHSQMLWKIIVLSKVCKFHGKAHVSESSFEKLQVLRNATLLKRDSNTGFFRWTLWIIQEYIFFKGSMNGSFWNTMRLLKSTFFDRIPPLVASDTFRFLPCNFIKKIDSGKDVNLWILQNF